MRTVASLTGDVSGSKNDSRTRQLTKLSELAVAEDECAQRSEALESLLSVLLGGVLVDRRVGSLGVTTSDLLCLPDEVLEKIALVLGEKQNLSELDDLAEITDKLLALRGQLL